MGETLEEVIYEPVVDHIWSLLDVMFLGVGGGGGQGKEKAC